MPKISVIVPVYQAEKFLRDCVESVRRQTFSDWELLLVDDGCTDGSPAICDELARTDGRIRVFHKERNSGVSETRNLGLDHARGSLLTVDLLCPSREQADALAARFQARPERFYHQVLSALLTDPEEKREA